MTDAFIYDTARTPRGKVEVTLEKDGCTRPAIWGASTLIGVVRERAPIDLMEALRGLLGFFVPTRAMVSAGLSFRSEEMLLVTTLPKLVSAGMPSDFASAEPVE
jgi:hypothetical protein